MKKLTTYKYLTKNEIKIIKGLKLNIGSDMYSPETIEKLAEMSGIKCNRVQSSLIYKLMEEAFK